MIDFVRLLRRTEFYQSKAGIIGKIRNRYFDVLKEIAIIVVVLCHLDTCEYGYLDVDIFFVIAVSFTSRNVDKQIVNGGISFVANRVSRLWPLLLKAAYLDCSIDMIALVRKQMAEFLFSSMMDVLSVKTAAI